LLLLVNDIHRFLEKANMTEKQIHNTSRISDICTGTLVTYLFSI